MECEEFASSSPDRWYRGLTPFGPLLCTQRSQLAHPHFRYVRTGPFGDPARDVNKVEDARQSSINLLFTRF
jgi:hypothetical protein